MSDSIARARLCGVASDANRRTPVCRIVPSDCSEVDNRTLYDDCTAAAPQFAVERNNANCIVRLEGETEIEGDVPVVTGPECCNCGDRLEFIGLNGIQVEVVDGAIKISKV